VERLFAFYDNSRWRPLGIFRRFDNVSKQWMTSFFKSLDNDSMTARNVEWPIALVETWIEDQVGLAAPFLPASGRALAKALAALSFRHVGAVVNARAHLVALVGCSGRGGRESGLEGAVFVVHVANGSLAARHSLRPVAPFVVGVVEQLLAIFVVARLDLGNVFRALEVLDAILGVGKQSVCRWTIKVDGGSGLLARPAVTVALAAVHQLRGVAPVPYVIV